MVFAGLDKGITMVVFDRGGFRYEGRVKAQRSRYFEILHWHAAAKCHRFIVRLNMF